MTPRASYPLKTRDLEPLHAQPRDASGALRKLLLPLGLLVVLQGCGAAARATIKEPGGVELPIEIVHEGCDLSRGEGTDVNGDGRPDVVQVHQNGREVCRMLDLNFDGKPDAFVYFDEQGKVRRRESDFDRDGRLDEVATYVAGVVARKDRDTNLDGKFDTWDFYENGKLVRRLRDTLGVGRVSQWWTFSKPGDPSCAVIQSDRNGDGEADPDDVVDTCADAEATEPAPTETAPASDGESGSSKAAAEARDDAEAAEPAEAGSEKDAK